MTDIVYNKNGVAFDIDAIATDLNGKMDRDGLNALASVCVESYVNGTSGYRVYSDGYCVQWGIGTTNNTSAISTYKHTITFLKQFANTNYNFQATGYSADDSYFSEDGAFESGVNSRTASTITVTHESQVTQWNWQASGYLN